MAKRSPHPDALFDAACDGCLTAEDRAALEALCSQSAQSLERYLDSVRWHAELAWQLHPRAPFSVEELKRLATAERWNEQLYAAVAGSPCEASLSPSAARSAAWPSSAARTKRFLLSHPWLLSFATATVTLLVIVATTAYLRMPQRNFAHPPNGTNVEKNGVQPFVATLGDVDDCRWGNAAGEEVPAKAFYRGRRLRSEETLHLLSGLAEIRFRDGAMVVLEGPCAFAPEGPRLGRLERGRLAATINKESAGFTVGTPLGDVVDLGTEFALDVSDGADSIDVVVFSGEVRFDRPAAKGGGYVAGRDEESPSGDSITLDAGHGAVRIAPAKEGEGVVVRPIPSNGGLARLRDHLDPKAVPGPLRDSFHVGDGRAASKYEYVAGPLAGQAPDLGGGMLGAWTAALGDDSRAQVRTEGLRHGDPRYAAASGGSVLLAGSHQIFSRRLRKPVTSATAGTLYLSFLMRLDTVAEAANDFRVFSLRQGAGAEPDRRRFSIGTAHHGGIELRINQSALKENLGAADGNVNLYVAKFTFSAAENGDSVTVWRNPDLNLGADPPGGVSLDGFDLAFDRLALQHGERTNDERSTAFDEVRMGATWGEVTTQAE